MKFSPKIKRGKDGGVEIRLSFSFTPEEVKVLDRLPDDPDINFDNLRCEGDQDAKVDFYLCQLRIICHWVAMWYNKELVKNHWHRWKMAREAKLNDSGRRKEKRIRAKRKSRRA
jgi:hypothetical protein